MIGMARPISNFANCLNDKTLQFLVAAARKMATTQVTFEELISEGWFAVVRYKKDPSYMWFDLIREMRKYICRRKSRSEEIVFEDRMMLRDEHDFQQWLRHRKYKLQR